jgi:hypothetical protein
VVYRRYQSLVQQSNHRIHLNVAACNWHFM